MDSFFSSLMAFFQLVLMLKCLTDIFSLSMPICIVLRVCLWTKARQIGKDLFIHMSMVPQKQGLISLSFLRESVADYLMNTCITADIQSSVCRTVLSCTEHEIPPNTWQIFHHVSIFIHHRSCCWNPQLWGTPLWVVI